MVVRNAAPVDDDEVRDDEGDTEFTVADLGSGETDGLIPCAADQNEIWMLSSGRVVV